MQAFDKSRPPGQSHGWILLALAVTRIAYRTWCKRVSHDVGSSVGSFCFGGGISQGLGLLKFGLRQTHSWRTPSGHSCKKQRGKMQIGANATACRPLSEIARHGKPTYTSVYIHIYRTYLQSHRQMKPATPFGCQVRVLGPETRIVPILPMSLGDVVLTVLASLLNMAHGISARP